MHKKTPDAFHIHTFSATTQNGKFTNPFAYVPSEECREAAHIVRLHIREQHKEWTDELRRGKMLGVLVCRDSSGRAGFLAAFSGTLGGRLSHEWFVPPVLDYERPGGVFKREEAAISGINKMIDRLANDPDYKSALAEYDAQKKAEEAEISEAKTCYAQNKQARNVEREVHPERKEELDAQSQFEKAEIKRLKARWAERLAIYERKIETHKDKLEHLRVERVKRSNILQRWLFSRMRLHRGDGRAMSIHDIFLRNTHVDPPSGSGECCAPRLLDYAFSNGLTPMSMAEFWMGETPAGEIRIDGEFYPACQRKCAPLLKWMLSCTECEAPQFEVKKAQKGEERGTANKEVEILYEDQWLLAVNKPAGLLTVSENDSVDTLMRRVLSCRSGISGPGYIHRLDQPTSGILLIAKDKQTHNKMQSQFEKREVRKSYVALLEGMPDKKSGVISLPIIPNPDDRPRQMVDFVRGKRATTEFEIIGPDEHPLNCVRVKFRPLTGRTHQLRVHAASPMGLGCPIVGDNLYGHMSDRLYLHADRLEFSHPYTDVRIIIECNPPF